MYISVALCSYNGAAYIQEQLNSIATQSRLPDELVICDDGSTDDSLSKILEFCSKVHFSVRVVNNMFRLGSAANFAKAIELCVGEIIVLADQDDIWHENRLESIEKKFMTATDLAGVFSNANLIDKQGRLMSGNLWWRVGFGKKKRAAIRRNQGFDILLRANVVTGATLCFREQFKSLVLPVPDGWVHDYWIGVLLSAVSRIDFIDAALIDYRCHPAQQLGIGRSAGSLLSRITEGDQAAYVLAASRWMDVYARLERYGLSRESPNMVKCKYAAEHMQRRGTLPHQLLGRLPIIFAETLRGNYSRYSLGISSILHDILSY